jgi:curved DNA-binding protein CbpA
MDHYDVIGVASDASSEAIQHAYHVRAQLLHPDRHHGAPPEVIAAAQREMTRLNEAREVLSDPGRRRAYDLSRSAGVPGAPRTPGGSGTSPGATATRPAPASHIRTAPPASPPPSRSVPLSKLCVTCAKCGRMTLADLGVSRVVCGHCGAGMRFATCPGCRRTVTHYEAGARVKCRLCQRQFKPLRGVHASQRAESQGAVAGPLLVAIPTFGLAVIVTASGGSHGRSFDTNLIGSFLCVCMLLFLIEQLWTRYSTGRTRPRSWSRFGRAHIGHEGLADGGGLAIVRWWNLAMKRRG